MSKVAIIMGSDSDLPIMSEAKSMLDELGIESFVDIVSAHRTPQYMFEFAQNAHKNGIKVIIAGAGGAAHLPGMVASLTPLPVVGVPIKTKMAFGDGMDALLSINQMPGGIPVATVAVDNAKNAGLLAARILGCQDQEILDKMLDYQEGLRLMVEGKRAKLKEEQTI